MSENAEMKMFVVKVGRETRKGGFQTLTEVYVKSKTYSQGSLRCGMANQYSGFDVGVIEAKNICAIEEPEKLEEKDVQTAARKESMPESSPRKKAVNYIASFNAKLNSDQVEKIKEIEELESSARVMRRNLKKEIASKYKALPYISGVSEEDVVIDLFRQSVKITKASLRWKIMEETVIEYE